MPTALNLVGRRFGRLTVIARAGSRYGQSAWLCRCDCGTEKVITASNLKNNTVSCGCYQKRWHQKHKQNIVWRILVSV